MEMFIDVIEFIIGAGIGVIIWGLILVVLAKKKAIKKIHDKGKENEGIFI